MIEDFLTIIQVEELIEIFEAEMIDLNVLGEITHEDLKNVGITRYVQKKK